MPNRLAAAASPYLRQHADNPVDWWEWGEEAFAEARRRNVPILLSVGYAACHWCHVMAHESFEDLELAALVNATTVPVKVDREERPDVDAAYMAAVTATTGHGGWPMTCLLTPEGVPFHAGTYYPPQTFRQLLTAADELWRERAAEVRDSAQHIAETLRSRLSPSTPADIKAPHLEQAVRLLSRELDPVRGGFGGAPKFPPSMVLEFLLLHAARGGKEPGSPGAALAMSEVTLEAMARGGMNDQLAGGFARYSVDADWVVPHFEKMLYDNALLLGAYTSWHVTTGSPLAARVVSETATFLLRDLRLPGGAFAAALDADTEGVEGATYAWTPAQLTEALGDEDGAYAASLLEVSAAGTFEHGSSTLQLRRDPEDPARWQRIRDQLLLARAQRPQPERVESALASWNGLTIAALVGAGQRFRRPEWVEAARGAASYLLDVHLVDGRLRRTSRDGVAGSAPGMADDHGNLAYGLVRLAEATGESRWLDSAGSLLDAAMEHHVRGDGGFHDAPAEARDLYLTPADSTDNAEPSGTSAMAMALLRYGAYVGSPRHLDAARAAVAASGQVARTAPRFAGWTLAAAQTMLDGPVQVTVVGEGPEANAMLDVASEAPWAVVRRGTPPEGAPDHPRPDHAAAYVCRGTVCGLALTSADALRAELGLDPTPGSRGGELSEPPRDGSTPTMNT